LTARQTANTSQTNNTDCLPISIQVATSREKITRRDRYARLRGRASFGGALVADVALRRGSLDALRVHRKPIASIRQSPRSLSSSSLIVVASARRSLPRGSDRGSSDRDTPRPNPRRAIDLSRVPRRPRRRSRAAVSPRTHFPAFIPDVRRRRRRRAVHRVRVSVELPSDPRTRNRPPGRRVTIQ
jgi:hypothetical protein